MLEIEQLVSGYGPVKVLQGISLSVQQNETVAILGPNGAGKSTLLMTIVGLLPVRAGTISFEGAPFKHHAPEYVLEKGIAMVPEGRRIFPGLTVMENLRMGAYQIKDKKKSRQLTEDIFEHFPRLAERTRQTAGTMSGGEQQQLAIARALMSQPRMLLLDEPSLGLAPVIVDVVMELIEGLKKQGLTIILVEQNIHQALSLADRAYVMANGAITMEGTAAELSATALDLQDAYFGAHP